MRPRPRRLTGSAASAYDNVNTEHRRVIGELGGLDQRLRNQIDRSAQVVTAGRAELDAVRRWVLDAAGSVPPNAAGERMLLPIVQRGLGEVAQKPLPNDFDWRAMQSLTLRVHRPELSREATVSLREVIEGSSSHPENTYYFDGVGWLDPTQVADQDGRTFLGPCTPDPAR